MKREHSIEKLETAQNEGHQRREWLIERLGWGAMLLIVLAALIGLLGPGPLTSSEVATADRSLSVVYDAVEHYEAPGRLIIRAHPGRGEGGLRLLLSRSFSDHAATEWIVPQPVSIEARDDDVLYTFAVRSSDAAVILFRYRYDDFAVFNHRIAIEGGPPIVFRQYVLP